MTTCPECGVSVTELHARCLRCGHDLAEQTRTCDNCGETIAADAEACPACGHLAVPAQCDEHGRVALGRCAVCSRILCEEEDRGGGRYHLCEDHADVPVIEGWAEVHSAPSDVEAHLIEENLRADGIDARVLSQKDHFSIPVEFGDLSRVRVLVPVYMYGAARQLIEDHSDSVGDVRFACPNCGEPYESGAAVCGTCGEAVR